MKLWIILLIVASFVFWFIVGKTWETSLTKNSYSNKDQHFVFPTPKITTAPFLNEDTPTMINISPISSASTGVIRY